jgi:hypothetical protein
MPEGDAASGGDAPAEPASGYVEATEQIRSAAKWLLGSFAAVGAVFAAGLQLANTGGVSAAVPSRLVATLVGLVLTVAGIIVAVWAVSDVLLRRNVSLADVISSADYATEKGVVSADKELYSPFESLEDLRAQIEVLGQDQKAQWEQCLDADRAVRAIERSALEGNPDDLAVKHAREQARLILDRAQIDRATYESTREQARHAGKVRIRVLEVVGFMRVRRAFQDSRALVAGATAAVAAGLIAFAWGANAPAGSALAGGEVLPRTPSRVTVLLTHPERFRAQLGAGCRTDTGLPAMAMTVRGETYQVATEKTRTCQSAWLTIKPEDGTVSPRAEASK